MIVVLCIFRQHESDEYGNKNRDQIHAKFNGEVSNRHYLDYSKCINRAFEIRTKDEQFYSIFAYSACYCMYLVCSFRGLLISVITC